MSVSEPGVEVNAAMTQTGEEAGPPTGQPEVSDLVRPKALFWNRPLTSDWIFWLTISFLVIGGGQYLFRTGQGYAALPSSMLVTAGFIDIAFNVVIVPVVFASIPASIRYLVRRSSMRRKLAVSPDDSSLGWKVDPLDAQKYRWWSDFGWTRATSPSTSGKLGNWGVIIYAACALAVTGVFFVGYATGDSSASSRSSVSSSGEMNANSALVAEVYFADLMSSVEAFLAVQVDVQNPAGSLTQASVAFDEVNSNFQLMNLLVQNTVDPANINLNPEQFAAMQNYMGALDSWVSVRADFYGELESCGMNTSGALGACEGEVLSRYEASLTNTTFPVVDAWEALQETLES